jgi:rubrerythrin
MNPFEYAMKMEVDGKKFYEQQAAKMADTALRKIYEELAKDEDKHYRIFKALKDGEDVDYAAAFKTDVVETAGNIFQQLKDENKEISDFPADVKEAWEKARDIEDDAEKFYREQSAKAESEELKAMWLQIANEEHKHWVVLDSVVQFISRPQQWLENAEWTQHSE